MWYKLYFHVSYHVCDTCVIQHNIGLQFLSPPTDLHEKGIGVPPISTCKWLLSMQQYCTNLLLNNLPPMHHKYYLLLPYASICQPLLDRGHQSFLSACYKDLLPSNRNGQLDWQPLHRKAPNASSTLSLLLCYSSFWITIFGAHMFLSVHFRIFA